jgi:hypothetical protein
MGRERIRTALAAIADQAIALAFQMSLYQTRMPIGSSLIWKAGVASRSVRNPSSGPRSAPTASAPTVPLPSASRSGVGV